MGGKAACDGKGPETGHPTAGWLFLEPLTNKQSPAPFKRLLPGSARSCAGVLDSDCWEWQGAGGGGPWLPVIMRLGSPGAPEPRLVPLLTWPEGPRIREDSYTGQRGPRTSRPCPLSPSVPVIAIQKSPALLTLWPLLSHSEPQFPHLKMQQTEMTR